MAWSVTGLTTMLIQMAPQVSLAQSLSVHHQPYLALSIHPFQGKHRNTFVRNERTNAIETKVRRSLALEYGRVLHFDFWAISNLQKFLLIPNDQSYFRSVEFRILVSKPPIPKCQIQLFQFHRTKLVPFGFSIWIIFSMIITQLKSCR